MARRGKIPGQDERLTAFAQRLNRAMLAKGWTGAELAREASKFAPKGVEIGRHLVSAYSRGANEPTDVNLGYIAKALGMNLTSCCPRCRAKARALSMRRPRAGWTVRRDWSSTQRSIQKQR